MRHNISGAEDNVRLLAEDIAERGLGNRKFTPAEIGELAEAIAEKLHILNHPDSEKNEIPSYFEECKETNMLVCIRCERFSTSPDVPQNWRKYCKGDLGKFLSANSANSQTNKDRRKRIQAHSTNSLHLWCVDQVDSTETAEVKLQEKNQKACDLIMKNVFYSTQNSGGAAEFKMSSTLVKITQQRMTASKLIMNIGT